MLRVFVKTGKFMNKKKKSSYIDKILSEYRKTFPQDWINKSDWTVNSGSTSYTEGKRLIDGFTEEFFVAFSKSILSGDYILKSTENIEELISFCEEEMIYDPNNPLKKDLQRSFVGFNKNIIDFSNQYLLNIRGLEEKLSISNNDFIVDVISIKSNNYANQLFHALEIVMNICFGEYAFAYNEDTIKSLIFEKDTINKIIAGQNNAEISSILKLMCDKIDYLLLKYSYYSDNKSIKYRLDFVPQTVKLEGKDSRFTSCQRYGYFLEPNSIPNSDIREWQAKCYKKNARIWEMALLMRYYTKTAKNEKQIENLTKQFDDFAAKLRKKLDLRVFDSYALNTITNYMHNCRLSFLISNKQMKFDNLVKELEEIESIQSTTGVKNYHPFKKAIEYLSDYIRKEMSEKQDISLILEHKQYYNKVLEKLQDAYKWCSKNQFYPFQLWYNECLDVINDMGIVVFTPSSFCRPIKYYELDEQIERLKLDSLTLDSELQLYKEEQEILELKQSIDKNKKSYIEILGVFTGLVTFLIGCITIFTNVENPKVSLFEKIEHISLLGIIVLLLINGGYFLTSEVKCKSFKFWFFLITSILYIFVLVKTYILQS